MINAHNCGSVINLLSDEVWFLLCGWRSAVIKNHHKTRGDKGGQTDRLPHTRAQTHTHTEL